MYLSNIKGSSFRNLDSFELTLGPDVNVVFGDNAAGKSSLLELIGYLISGRSFRTNKQQLLVTHDSSEFFVFGEFSDGARLGVNYSKTDKSRKIRLDGKNIRSLSQVAAIYPVQTISPESYHLIDSGPSERRKFVDWLLFHVEHSYLSTWQNFNRLLKQRNRLLRLGETTDRVKELESWDEQFLQIALEVDKQRKLLLAGQFSIVLKQLLESVKFEYTEEVRVSYYSGFTDKLQNKLIESRKSDFINGTTQYGPHKADIRIKIGSLLAKDVLSRGQKKLLINCLYLAQTAVLKKESKKDSLFVVDDFSSELDQYNQGFLLDTLQKQENVQIILSCLQPDMIKPFIKEYNSAMMFHVEHGVISQVMS
jgi:DNA replication and repair protein RecF